MSASAFDELRAGFDEPFWALGSDAARDRGAVVISWPSIPIELVRAAGFLPVFPRGRSAPTPAADRVLEPELFPNRLRQLVEAALTGRLHDVAAIILPRSSDPDYKCFLYLRELERRGVATALPPVLLLDLLHSDGAEALAYNADRARALSAQLTSLSGRQLEADGLHCAIASANRARAAARRLTAQRTGTPRLAGGDALPLLGAFWQLEPERYASLANAAAESAALHASLEGSRTLIAGTPVDGTTLHAAVEAAGGLVVAELSPFSCSSTSEDVEIAVDPVASLVEFYRRESLDARLPVSILMRKLEAMLINVDAVVLSYPPDDASYGWDYPRIRELLAARSIPHTVLVSDPAHGATGPDLERIQSLLGSARIRQEANGG
jgi:benzoyl-CoA reductase/2-hydroxyglutaryl-CoA dehydratase subunit BcrC/BadD/HgdB